MRFCVIWHSVMVDSYDLLDVLPYISEIEDCTLELFHGFDFELCFANV